MTLFNKVMISICIVIFLGFGWYALGNLFQPKSLTQEQLWVREMDERCQAALGKGTYIQIEKAEGPYRMYECWQTPAFRRPKLVFKVPYI